MDYYHKLLLTGIISTGIMISHLVISHWSINSSVLNRGCKEVVLRLSKYVISVSKRHKNNHAGVKNGTWSIYYYDEDWKLQTKRINPLLIGYYKLIRRHRKKMYCLNCKNSVLVLTNWYDRKIPDCPYCEYDDLEY